MGNISLEKAIEVGIQAGIKEALERIEQDKRNKKKFQKDRRLRNTELLLRNYTGFVEHYKEAVCSQDKVEAEDPESVLEDIEMEFDYNYDEVYINSIKRTKTRTKIMINHIERIISFYKYQAENSKDINLMRRYMVIESLFLHEKTWEETADKLHCSKKTVGRDKKIALEELSVLFFGIDGLKFHV
jgi:hypothetical protein